MNLGNVIKEKRIQVGLSQTELARHIKKSPQLICDIEAGRKFPSLETLVEIAKELCLSLDKIFLN
ncbi:helix-turn-helix transcriptional regulator [Petroclostridium sp. X23]|uniref:helix-turn-helix transcriptional regulator n=1 Tax=Petroclostridium sp. X23 TaxID=3045146 RepID=UPI0024AE41EF|nr:helix-turn-helix transcriptional regulator [Petroclostridium sp. X23]WHH58445.1 helix-turn-helix transcriptional regulator [Petroclostridium sp. X23]